MTGLSTLLFTSKSGAKFTWIPISRHCRPTSSPYASNRDTSSIAPNIIFFGKRVVPERRIDNPHSPSSDTISGTKDSSCMRFVSIACERVFPLWNKTPPIFTSCTKRSKRRLFCSDIPRSAIGMNNCPIFASSSSVKKTESTQCCIFSWSAILYNVGSACAQQGTIQQSKTHNIRNRFIINLHF